MWLWLPRNPLRIPTRKSSLFYSTYFFINNILLTYFISTSLFQFTQILYKFLYVLIIDIRCWNFIHLYITFKCFVILLELITIPKDRGSAWSGLELFRVASWHIGLDHVQLHCNSSY